MTELLQSLLGRFALCGLLASLLAWLLFSAFRALRHVRIPASTACALLAAALVAIEVGGTKTNDPPSRAAGPQRSAPQMSFAEWRAQNWNTRGAWKDSFWLGFAEGWAFPHGTNHLSGVEVVSQGRLWPTPFDANAVASAGAPFEVVPGLTTFGYELTPSNSYRFAWADAAVDRDTNNLVSATIELFRSGDVAVATNGVETLFPRELPFAHHGFGQDAEWVAANFTNATEILSAGYPQWVDAQVGAGLLNGLYRLMVSVPDDPPETTFLFVGDYSVAVTNAGEYVFLLEKGIDYPLSVFPADCTNLIYSAVDDIPALRAPPASLRGGASDGRWTRDSGRLELIVPIYPLVPFSDAFHVIWLPTLAVSPETWQPSGLHGSETFSALLADVPRLLPAAYRWSTSNPAIVSVASPTAPTTQMTAHDASAMEQISLSLEATLAGRTLHSYYVHNPQNPGGEANVALTVSAPEVLFVNDDDDNANGSPDVSDAAFLGDDDCVPGHILFHSPAPTNGTITVEGVYGYDEGFGDRPLVYVDEDCTESLQPGRTFALSGVSSWSQALYFNPATVSAESPGVQVKVRWHPEAGGDLTASAFLTIVSPVAEPVCGETTNVVEGGVAHAYAVNPCGVAVGRDGYFRVDVAPASFPDEKIVWTASEGLSFTGPRTGRSVTVRGETTGYETLTVQVGDSQSDAPEFDVRVVEPTTVNLRAWIIENREENVSAKTIEQVRQMVKDANDIYAQVGVTLNLVEPVVVTNIPDAYDALYDTPTNATATWSFDQIVNIASNTGGLECYFINKFVDKPSTKAAHNGRGIVMTTLATQSTLAHEIGHAFGMSDIYITNDDVKESADPLISLFDGEKASWSHMSEDWNGGCFGRGFGGARYYRFGTAMKEIVGRMLMLGLVGEDDERRDISSGHVYGVFYEWSNDVKVWQKDAAPVAFPWQSRNPVHH